MKKTLIVAIIASSTLLLSCETASDRLENSTDMTNETTITMDNPFKLTV